MTDWRINRRAVKLEGRFRNACGAVRVFFNSLLDLRFLFFQSSPE